MALGKHIMLCWAAAFCLGWATGCASDPVLHAVEFAAWDRAQARSALQGYSPSEFTKYYLQQRGLVTTFTRRPEQVLVGMEKELCTQANRDTVFALSELCYLRAKLARPNSKRRRMLYLSAARYAYACLFDKGAGAPLNEFDPRLRLACRFYNRALAALIQDPQVGTRLVRERTSAMPLLQGTLSVHTQPDSGIQLARLDRDSLAYNYDAAGFAIRNRRFGVGVPIIAERTAPTTAQDPNGAVKLRLPPVTAATALLRFDTRICETGSAVTNPQADFVVFDPVKTPEIEIAGRHVPLEADLTTPLSFMLDANRDLTTVAGKLKKLDGDAISDRRGLYLMQPYQPGKIPVVFVHGLMADPTVWLPMLNRLSLDPVLLERYQFWLFFYSTSNPIIFSGAELRESLQWTRRALDPAGRDAALDQMVLVGHSMGGLLARMMIQRGESSLIESHLGTPVAELDISAEKKNLLRRMEIFEPLPFVDRVVFLATPHRGANIACGGIGRIGALMSDAPSYVSELMAGLLEAVGMDPRDLPTGIDDLCPDSQFTSYINSLPMAQDVPYHSIIGNKWKADTPGGTDGWVAYGSCHLEGAASEKIVRCGHKIMNHPQAILEVRRILLLHLEK